MFDETILMAITNLQDLVLISEMHKLGKLSDKDYEKFVTDIYNLRFKGEKPNDVTM